MIDVVGLHFFAAKSAHGRQVVDGQRLSIERTGLADFHPLVGSGTKDCTRVACGRCVHPLQPPIRVINERRLRNLIEDRVRFRDIAQCTFVQQGVVQRDRCVAADLAEKRDLLLRPVPHDGRSMDTEGPRFVFARTQDLHDFRTHLKAFRQLRIEIAIAFLQDDRTRRCQRPPNQVARASQWQRIGIVHRLRSAGRIANSCGFGCCTDRIEEPGPVGGELFARQIDDSAHDFAKVERGAERLENREASVARLLGAARLEAPLK